MNKKISIIIPAYNEELRIGETLKIISDYLSKKDFDYEVLVINDGSKDKTISIASSYSNLFKDFRIIDNGINKGKGFSVRNGMFQAKGDLKLFADADNSVDISNLDRFIDYINEGYDIVVGSIEIKGSSHKDNNQWYRRILGKLSKILIRITTTPGIYDTQRGFKLFTKESAEKVFEKQTIDRFGFDIEDIVIAQKAGFRIKEVPVEWNNKEFSSVGLNSYFKTLSELFIINLNRLRGRY